MNFGTFAVLFILLAVIGIIVFTIIKDRKQGKNTCGHGCANCAMHGQCHKK